MKTAKRSFCLGMIFGLWIWTVPFAVKTSAQSNPRSERSPLSGAPQTLSQGEIDKVVSSQADHDQIGFSWLNYDPDSSLNWKLIFGGNRSNLGFCLVSLVEGNVQVIRKGNSEFDCPSEFPNPSPQGDESASPLKGEEYALAEPLTLPFGVQAQVLSVEQVSKMISSERVLFYTGAGISAGSVLTLSELESRLHFPGDRKSLDQFRDFEGFLNQNPDKIFQMMRDFLNSCQNAKPTAAHIALKNIALKLNLPVVTENFDWLHLKSGIQVPMIVPSDFKTPSSLKELSKLHFIITIGLREDDRGFLAFAKEQNPALKIIAFNTHQPLYLSSNDFQVTGDVQETLPELETLLTTF